MRVKTLKAKNRIFLGIINLAIFVVIMVVGLWPFNFRPENKVKWLTREDGVRFLGQGLIYTPQPISNPFKYNDTTIELEIQPEKDTVSYIAYLFSFLNESGKEILFVGQWKSHLVLRRMVKDATGRPIRREIGLRDVLPRGKKRLVTITSHKEGTTIYIDGTRLKNYPQLNFLKLNDARSGQVVLGNSSTGKNHWNGDLSFIALYREALTPSQVLRHSDPGAKQRLLLPPEEEKVTARYLFTEGTGDWIYDRSGQKHLFIPPKFGALQKTVLVPPWDDFRLTRSYLMDVLTNIFGFIPFGFFFSAFFWVRKPRSIGRPLMVSILIAGSISLSIELLQVYLPTRNSQLMDVICNNMGAGIGASACLWIMGRKAPDPFSPPFEA